MIQHLSLETELRLIEEAKAGSNEAAQTLLDQYRPALLAGQRRTYGTLDHTEARSAVNSAFMEALHRFDPARHNRLATVIKSVVVQELDYESRTKQAFSIPSRSISRYWSINRSAGRDLALAAEIANQHGMNRATWLSIHDSMNATHLPEPEADHDPVFYSLFPEPEEATPFQKETVKAIFEKRGDEQDLTDLEVQIISVHYGLAGVDTDKDYEFTAEELGLPKAGVIKLHGSAIRKARKRLKA